MMTEISYSGYHISPETAPAGSQARTPDADRIDRNVDPIAPGRHGKVGGAKDD